MENNLIVSHGRDKFEDQNKIHIETHRRIYFQQQSQSAWGLQMSKRGHIDNVDLMLIYDIITVY